MRSVTVSVIIPTYNRYTFLKRAIASVYRQTFENFEVIVVDDGSTDGSERIEKDFPKIRYFYQKNKGVSSARNYGVERARGEWVAFLDSDDEWVESKLAAQLQFHTDHPDIFVSYTDERWFVDTKERNIPKKFHKIGKDPFVENIRYCNIAPSSVMIRKEFFVSLGGFDESLRVCEDYDLWLRIAKDFSIGFIDEKLLLKHAHSNDQLGFSPGITKIHIEVLQKLRQLPLTQQQKRLVDEVLNQKLATTKCGIIASDCTKSR